MSDVSTKKCKTCGKEKQYLMSWETECYSCRGQRHEREIKIKEAE